MDYTIELSDKSFNRLEYLEREAMGLTWGYNRIGGCASFSFSLPREYCNERYISGDFNVKIHVKNPVTGDFDLWYQGLVESKVPAIHGGNEVMMVKGSGYQSQLKRQYIEDQTYTATELSLIVTDIINTYVAPYTDITLGTITPTTFTPSTIKFNTDALNALQTCADLANTYEWGVNADREFFFVPRSTSPDLTYPLGSKKILNFSSDDSFKDIVNRVLIQGGDVAGTPYTKTFDRVSSQLKYNIRSEVEQNSSITTDDVAEQFAEGIFEEFAQVVRRGQVDLLEERQIEAVVPIPLFHMKAPAIQYGEKAYGVFLYSGRINYQVNRITYTIDKVSNLKINMDLGQLRPSLSEQLAQIEYELEQLRSGAL